MPTIIQTLDKLQMSKFRSSFYLTKKEKAYIAEKGMDTVHRHAADFVRMKLAAPAQPNDGKQTPMHGHPAFKAWYKVRPDRELTEDEQSRIVNLMMAWIERNNI
ncbi:MAG: DUF4186 family protein [Eubacteriales bacterium]|nr:DUF4186 family protein [Eubacteriales bacterium]